MKYYCIGIKGAGLSTLAKILHDLGNQVIGYDDNKNYTFTEEGLRGRGIICYYDQRHNVESDSIVICSPAFKENHPEIVRVKKLGLKLKEYKEMIGDLTKQFETTCISGTHGKTTTSLLLSNILKDTIGCNYFVGDGTGYASKDNKLFVLESCEYNKNFLSYYPANAVVTNIELEHVECYDGLDDIINTFEEFVNKATRLIVMCGDDKNVRKINVKSEIMTIYYGFNTDNDLIAKEVELTDKGSKFNVYYKDKLYGEFNIPIYGEHMILNSLATIAICKSYDISTKDIHKYLESFISPKRRFKEEFIKDIVIIDDYAHHPTEVRVTIEAARQKYPTKKIVAVLQPNTYSRTKELYPDFANALNLADISYVTPIYCDREKQEDFPDVTSNLIVGKLKNGYNIDDNSIKQLLEHENAVIIFMSCKNIYIMKENFQKLLNKKYNSQ